MKSFKPLLLLVFIQLLLLTIHGTEYVILTSGPSISITHGNSSLKINNQSCAQTNCSKDNIYMVTVLATGKNYKPPLLPFSYYFLLEKERLIYPYNLLYGNDETEKSNTKVSFDDSIDTATIAAFQYMNKEYSFFPVVTNTINYYFNIAINPNDIVTVNNKEVKNLEELNKNIESNKDKDNIVIKTNNGTVYTNIVRWNKPDIQYGDILTQVDKKTGEFSLEQAKKDGYLSFLRNGNPQKTNLLYSSIAPLVTTKHPILKNQNLFIGLNNPDIGGESAGAAIATSIIDILKYNGKKFNKTIGVTGAIDKNGVITPIGGVALKALSVKKQGIKFFFIPENNCEEIQNSSEHIKNKLKDLKIIKTKNLNDIYNTNLDNIQESSLCKL